MLLPALSKAKAKAQAISCLSNQRQWGLAIQIYATDSNDTMPRDGTDSVNGSYASFTGNITGPGSPQDENAWFNVLPSTVGDKPLSFYFNGGIKVTGISKDKFPFPGNPFGKIWMCPSAKAVEADEGKFLKDGAMGYFCYVMNLDLKLKRSIANGVVGNSFTYPYMPKLSSMRKSSATVLLSEFSFSPTLENWTASGTPQMGCFPAARWTYFPKRHNDRGSISFLDGHSQIFKFNYVVKTKADGSPDIANREEKFNEDIWWNPNRDIP